LSESVGAVVFAIVENRRLAVGISIPCVTVAEIFPVETFPDLAAHNVIPGCLPFSQSFGKSFFVVVTPRFSVGISYFRRYK